MREKKEKQKNGVSTFYNKVEEMDKMEAFSKKRNIIKLLLDTISLTLSLVVAFILKHEGDWDEMIDTRGVYLYLGIFTGVYFLTELSKKSWSYMSTEDMQQILGVNILTGIIYGIFKTIFIGEVYLTVLVLVPTLSTICHLSSRYIYRKKISAYRSKNSNRDMYRLPAIIFGAGELGTTLVQESKKNPKFPYEIVGFIDDEERKNGVIIHGVKVFGSRERLEETIEETGARVVIIAVNSLNSKDIKNIMKRIHTLEVEVKIVPGIERILSENLINHVRDVSIEDLLGREQIEVNGDEISEAVEKKSIFVTGGAGSIGSEITRQIAKYNPKEIVVIDINENQIYFLELEMKRKYPDLNIISEICNVRDEKKVDVLFEKYRPDIVFHAAAHKHVPLMEHNPEEAIKNNLFGTKNVARCADRYKVGRFVLISTDKAVNPTNIMGATKRGCELIIEGMNKRSQTKFMAVRFGNVLGSDGSVVPIFKKLIAEGKNLTITHPEITRYFMTIPEAAQLVIEAGAIGEGGEVFILDMGKAVKIMDLAKSMIKLSRADVEIEIVGLRPGEKLYEELLYDVKAAIKTKNKKIFINKIHESDVDVEENLKILERAVDEPKIDELKELMKRFITSYREPSHHIKEEMKMS